MGKRWNFLVQMSFKRDDVIPEQVTDIHVCPKIYKR